MNEQHNRDGKEAVSTTATLISSIAKLTLAIQILYAVNDKFPSLFPKIKAGAKGAIDQMMKIGLVSKAAGLAGAAWQKLGEKFPRVTNAIKGTGTAMGKLPGILLNVSGKFSRVQQITALLTAIGAPAIAMGILGLAAALTTAAAALAAFTASRISASAAVADFADALNTTAKKIQILQMAASATGAKFQDVAGAIENIQKAIAKAVTGNDEYVKALKQLGFTLDDVKRRGEDSIFEEISEGVRTGRIGIAQQAALLKVLGDEAKKLKSAMQDGIGKKSGLREWLAVPASDIEALDNANTALKGLWSSAKGLLNLVVSNRLGEIAKPFFGSGSSDFDIEAEKRLQAARNRRDSIRAAEGEEAEALRKKNQEKERELQLERMTTAERKAALEAERMRLMTAMENERSAVKQQELYGQLLEVEANLLRQRETRRSGQAGMPVATDALKRMGLTRGGTSTADRQIVVLNQQLAIQRNQLNIQRDQLKELEKNRRESERFFSEMRADA
jgi:hypothetical protein